MEPGDPSVLKIEYDPVRVIGRIDRGDDGSSSPIWERLRAHFGNQPDVRLTDHTIDMPWPKLLEVVREFGTKSIQSSLNFRFRPEGQAADRIAAFVREV